MQGFGRDHFPEPQEMHGFDQDLAWFSWLLFFKTNNSQLNQTLVQIIGNVRFRPRPCSKSEGNQGDRDLAPEPQEMQGFDRDLVPEHQEIQGCDRDLAWFSGLLFLKPTTAN